MVLSLEEALMSLTQEALESLKSEAVAAADLVRLIGTPTRLLLLCHLAQGECSVAELERGLGVRQPGLSQQLSELRQNNLVKTRRESRSIFYSISDLRVLRVLEGLHSALFKEHVATAERPRLVASNSLPREAAQFAKVIR
ncbi:metalloregulator ArsR/SmtB family transcription factor [Pseudomonas fluorescens]|nr:metalloregulator ArsR/SmtB family transcription factor [Pseudomonas fluorescens]